MQHFLKTRQYLEQVRDASQKVEMLKERIALCVEAGEDAAPLRLELDTAEQNYLRKKIEVSSMIERIPRTHLQWILNKYYVNLLTWYEIGRLNKTGMRRVTQDHGLALPEMQDVLVEAGIIAPEDAEDIGEILEKEGCLDVGTMQDYLKYREEKMQGAIHSS